MTSPGFIERSSSRMIPLTKFDTIFCRPKPMPTPTAPLKTAKAVRSMPTALRPISSATEISAILMRLPASARTEGLSAERRWSRVSTTRARPRAIHSKMARMNTALITSSTRPPYAPEFRRQIVELVRAGRDPAELAREFEPTAQSISHWVAQADRQEGRREEKGNGLSAAEREELARLRRGDKQLPAGAGLPSPPGGEGQRAFCG